MAGVLTKKRYRFGGTFTTTDADGLPHEFSIGHDVPDWLLGRLAPGEVDSLRGTGMLREIGAKPAPRPAEPPPRPLTVAETLRQFGFEDDPRGTVLIKVDKPRDSDFQRVLELGRDTPILVHHVDGVPVATLSLARLCQLLAARGLVR